MFTKILESLPNQLEPFCLDQSIAAFERSYAGILHHYFSGNAEALRRMRFTVEGDVEKKLLEALRDARIVIRSLEGSISLEQMQFLLGQAKNRTVVAGEVNMVLGMYFETLHDEMKSYNHYKAAHDVFIVHGCRRRTVRSLHNALAAQSRIDPTRRLLVEYNKLVLRARECEDWGTVGSALTNISREFQTMGLLYAALRYANEAVDAVKTHCPMSHPYYLALLHRAHVASGLAMQIVVKTDLEEAHVAPFPEIKAASEALRAKIFGTSLDEAKLAFCNATWKERATTPEAFDKGLGELEQGLICALSEGPKTRYELIDCIYPEGKNILALENRLKQILHRLRKRYPGLIGKSGRHYCLLEQNPIPPGLVM